MRFNLIVHARIKLVLWGLICSGMLSWAISCRAEDTQNLKIEADIARNNASNSLAQEKTGQVDGLKDKVVRGGNVHIGKNQIIHNDLIVRGGSVIIDGKVQGDCIVQGGLIHINGHVLGDVTARGGNIAVTDSGVIGGDIMSYGGQININGLVNGDVQAFGGNIKLGPSAVVNGDVATMGGHLEMDEKAQVHGEIEQNDVSQLEQIPENLMSNWLNVPAFWEKYHAFSKFSLFYVKLAILGILVLLTALLVRERVARVAQTMQDDFWRSMGFGVLIEICITPVLILLCISCVGIPFVPIAALILLAAVIMAYSAVSFIIGKRICPVTTPVLLSIMLGFLLLHCLFFFARLIAFGSWPRFGFEFILIFINFLVVWFFITVGLGAVWTTRFGGNLPAGMSIMQCSAPISNTSSEQPKGKEKEVDHGSTLNNNEKENKDK